MNLRAAVFLDRDGVINAAVVREGKPYPPDRVGDVEILPDVPGALRLLSSAGYLLVVVTNQPDVARGKQSRAEVDEIHSHLRAHLPLDAVYCCMHDDRDACRCRKPAPGMMHQAAAEFGIDLARSYLVGDRWRDVEAGQAAGCATVFIDRGYAERKPERCDHTCDSLGQAASWILAQARGADCSGDAGGEPAPQDERR